VIKLRDFVELERERSFASPKDIKTSIEKFAGFQHREEPLADREVLLIFESSKQRTWLVATKGALYCVIDRLSEPEPRARWRIGMERIFSNKDGIFLSIQTEEYSDSAGHLVIDKKRPRLYSRRLFTDFPVEQRIKSLLLKALDVKI